MASNSHKFQGLASAAGQVKILSFTKSRRGLLRSPRLPARSTAEQEAAQGSAGAGPYSRGVRREAHGQEGVQERGGAAAPELVGDLGVELRLPRCHLFLPRCERLARLRSLQAGDKAGQSGGAEAARRNLNPFLMFLTKADILFA